MSLFLQAMQGRQPAEHADEVQPQPADADSCPEAELSLEPTGQPALDTDTAPPETVVTPIETAAHQPTAAVSQQAVQDDRQARASAVPVEDDVPPARQSAEAALGSIAIIEPILMLVAALAAIGLLAGLYLLLAGFENFGEVESAALQREMDTLQAQVSELQLTEQDEVVAGNREAAPEAEAVMPVETQLVKSTADSSSAAVLAPPDASPSAEPPGAVTDKPAIDDVLTAEFAALKAQMSAQNTRIDQLIDENSRLQKLVATPPAVKAEKPTAPIPKKRDEVPVPAPKKTVPVVSISEQPAKASSAVRVDGAQTGVGARSIDDEAVAVTDRFRLLLRQGYAAYQSGDYAVADSFYDQALLLEPYNRDVNLAVASVARQLSDFRRAENRYRHLLSLDGQDSAAFTGLLDVASALGDDTIEHELVAHIGTIESPGRMHAALGNYYSAKRSWQLARDAWRDALAIDVSNPDYAFNLAVSLDNLQRHKSAIDYYEMALQHAATRTFHFDKPTTRGRLETLMAAHGQ